MMYMVYAHDVRVICANTQIQKPSSRERKSGRKRWKIRSNVNSEYGYTHVSTHTQTHSVQNWLNIFLLICHRLSFYRIETSIWIWREKIPACACAPPPIELNARTNRNSIQTKYRTTHTHGTDRPSIEWMCGKIWPLVIKSVAFFYFRILTPREQMHIEALAYSLSPSLAWSLLLCTAKLLLLPTTVQGQR